MMAGYRLSLTEIGRMVLLLIILAALPVTTLAWTLELSPAATVPVKPVKLADVVVKPVPERAAAIILVGAGTPGTTCSVDRRLILRKLVEAGQSDGVRFAGAAQCRISFAGCRLNHSELERRVRQTLQSWLPDAEPAAPPSWCEIKLPHLDLTVENEWSLELVSPRQLKPGRNLLQARITGPSRASRFTVTVLCHVFGEVGRANGRILSGTELNQELFTWEWQDLSQIGHGVVVGRASLQATSARRDISIGDLLRRADLKQTPIIRQGQPVDLVLRQGAVQVKVRGTARQDGLMNQTITVRNQLTGRLVTGRVIGPGLVAWGR